MSYELLTDKEATFAAMRRQHRQREEKKHEIIKCTNCGVGIEILKPEDQFITCPQCSKRFYLTYSSALAKAKMYSEGS